MADDPTLFVIRDVDFMGLIYASVRFIECTLIMLSSAELFPPRVRIPNLPLTSVLNERVRGG